MQEKRVNDEQVLHQDHLTIDTYKAFFRRYVVYSNIASVCNSTNLTFQ